MSAQRFYWGIGYRDKQIDFSKEKAIEPAQNEQLEREKELIALLDQYKEDPSSDPIAKTLLTSLTAHQERSAAALTAKGKPVSTLRHR
jgi:hypothetical protein